MKARKYNADRLPLIPKDWSFEVVGQTTAWQSLMVWVYFMTAVAALFSSGEAY